LAELEAHLQRIKGVGLPASFNTDVLADHWTKLAYVKYERALEPAARAGISCNEVLTEAKKHLIHALNLKANWNPAQIYLALVYRIHSGVAEAMGNTIEQKRYSGEADRLFSALRGVQSAEPKPEPPAWEVTGSIREPGARPQEPPNWQLNVEGSLRPATKKGESQF